MGPLHTEILKLFPQAARQERRGMLLAWVAGIRTFQHAWLSLTLVRTGRKPQLLVYYEKVVWGSLGSTEERQQLKSYFQ